MKKINIGVKGAYGERNFGDDALMYFIYKWFQNEKIKVSFIGRSNAYVRKMFKDIDYINKLNLHKYFFNKLVLGGGTQFFSFKDIKNTPTKIQLLLTNPILFFNKLYGLIERKFFYSSNNVDELHAFGIGFGPFIKNSDNENKAIKQITLMESVFPRDNYSYIFSKKYNHNTIKGTDICFLPNIINFEPFQNNSTTIKRIGIIVRDWNYKNGGENYLQVVLSQLEQLKEYEVDFIFFKDEKKCEELLENHNIIKWTPETQTIDFFLRILSNYDLFITSRFHGVIFGSLLNIPSIAIEIEPKLNLTKEMLGEGVKVWKQPFDVKLKSIIEDIELIKIKKELRKNIEKQSVIAENMFKELSTKLR